MRAVRNTEQGIRVTEVAPPVAPDGVIVAVRVSLVPKVCGLVGEAVNDVSVAVAEPVTVKETGVGLVEVE